MRTNRFQVKNVRMWIVFLVGILPIFHVLAQTKRPIGQGGYYRVVVTPADTTLATGGEVDFKAFLVDSTGAKKDTRFFWSLAGRPIGLLSQGGHFKAMIGGKAVIVATTGRFSGKAQVTVLSGDNSQRGYRVAMVPKDTVLKPGDEAVFQALLLDTTGKPVSADFNWGVDNPRVGRIDSNGKFKALLPGRTFVIAKTGSYIGKANVAVLRDSLSWWRQHKQYQVVVTPKDTAVRIGSQARYRAVLLDSVGKSVYAKFTWSVENDLFAAIDENGILTAKARGQGFVFATTGNFSGMAHVTVLMDTGQGWNKNRNKICLIVQPRDTIVAIGASVSYAASWVDTNGVRTPAKVAWDMASKPIGAISGDGVFKALFRGIGLVRARADGHPAILARVLVVSFQELTRLDSIRVHFKDKTQNTVGAVHRFREKDVIKIGGLPFPLSIFNGGELILPPGSISSDIRIDITLPDLARMKNGTTLDFLNPILTGVRFQVYVNDRPISPFIFGAPVQVVLPYKPELMTRLGLTPERLWAFFYTENGRYDSTGILDVVVDTSENKIYIEASHFSDIVVADKNMMSVTGVGSKEILPGAFRLHENYPNPFNPETRIRFDVGGSGLQKIRLSVYDILGREIRVLADRPFAPGSHEIQWDGKNSLGHAQVSGMYILRMESADGVLIRRMVMMK